MCRAFLSEWVDPETGKGITTGRANIGAVSLNLPMIWQKSKGETFYQDLDFYLDVCRKFLLKRYDAVASAKCSTNPMCFTQGGLYKGNKGKNDKVGDLIEYMTASFGITALHELTMLAKGVSIAEDNSFAVEVVEYIQNKVNEFKKEDGRLYALYSVPAESLCGTQVKQFRTMFGVIEGVSDRDYFTNSFHCHVGEKISPFEKQEKEEKLFHMINGGHIQYVRIDNTDNKEGMKAIIRRGMLKGFYQGVNFPSTFCKDCGGHHANGGLVCKECGSTNTATIDRVCGYLGYSNVNGETRMNDAKMSEINDRKSM